MVDDFTAIYERYGKVVYLYLLSLTGDESLSEELTQETMFRAIMNISTFRGESKLSTWLCQIAKNLYFEHCKKQKRHTALDENANFPAGNDLSMDFADRDMAQRILMHLHELSEPYKEVFILHALGDVSLTEISRLFGKSDSWARVTYYRAKTMIISKLEVEI